MTFSLYEDPPPCPSRNGGERLALEEVYRVILLVIILFFCLETGGLPSLTGGVGGGSLFHDYFFAIHDVDAALQLLYALTSEVEDYTVLSFSLHSLHCRLIAEAGKGDEAFDCSTLRLLNTDICTVLGNHLIIGAIEADSACTIIQNIIVVDVQGIGFNKKTPLNGVIL